VASSYDHLDVFPVTQFHRHIHGIRDDGNIAEHLKTSNHFGGCGAAAQCNLLARADEFRCSEANATLLFGKPAHLVLEGTVMPKRLVEQWSYLYSAAAGAPQQRPRFEVF